MEFGAELDVPAALNPVSKQWMVGVNLLADLYLTLGLELHEGQRAGAEADNLRLRNPYMRGGQRISQAESSRCMKVARIPAVEPPFSTMIGQNLKDLWIEKIPLRFSNPKSQSHRQ